MSRRYGYDRPVKGERPLVAFDGFMKGWEFGSSIMREKEDRADREQKRRDDVVDRSWKSEERERTREGWTQADEDREYTVATRESVEDVKAGRARGVRKDELGIRGAELGIGQKEREERQAPTDAEAKEARGLDLEGKRIGNKNAKDANARAWNDDRRQADKAKKDAEKDSGGKVLAALDYFQRNQALLDPAKMNSVERLYTAFSTGNMSKASREDVKASADVIAPVLDKRTDFNGMPIVERSYTPLFKDGKIVLEVAYKVKKPDGSIVDASAGPIRRATADGTDAIYEMDDADAMQLLAAHTLLGRDIKKMVDAGYSNPNDAINELREAYIAQQGGGGVDELKKIDPKAADGMTREKVKYGDNELTVQIEKGGAINDDTPVVGGMVEDPKTGDPVPVATVGDAKRALGLAPAAPAGEAPTTVSTQAQVAALPKGAKFIFNGKEYTKK